MISGKSRKNELVSFLLNVENSGREASEKFIEECIEDTTRFEKSKTFKKINSFSRKRWRNFHDKFDEEFIWFHIISLF